MRATDDFLTAAPRRSFDATTLLVVWSFFLLIIPGNFVVGALGAAGSPAQLVGLLALGWWSAYQLDRFRPALLPTQPVRRAMLIFVMAVLCSYLVAATRPIDDLELRSADRGVMLALSWLGIVLLASDGVPHRDRLDRVVRAIVVFAGLAAALGILQFFTGDAFIDKIKIPGLTANQDLTSIYNRNGFSRAAGTATHPIEFGVMLTMVLPLALHYLVSGPRASRFVRWFPVIMIGIAIPVTISRSAILGVIVVFCIVLPAWPKARRRITYLSTLLILMAAYVGVPGLLGTLIRLFTGVSNDDSARSRTDSYQLAWSFIERSPFFGRGVSTFLPEYRILDNQYLGLTIETGFVGLLSFLALLITGMWLGTRVVRSTADESARSLARSIVAAIAAAAIAYATFDGFGFQQVAGLTFFLFGAVAALHRLAGGTPRPRRGRRRRRAAAERTTVRTTAPVG